MEYICDVITVRAKTRREAVSLGVALMLKINGRDFKWCRESKYSGESPYRGVRAEPAPWRTP